MANDFRPGSKQEIIASHYRRGLTADACFKVLSPIVAAQSNPALIFKANVGGRRAPKTIFDQKKALFVEINRVYGILDKTGEVREPQTPEVTPPVAEETPRVAPFNAEAERYLARVRELRAFCKEREAIGQPIDEITMRPTAVFGRAGLKVGIPGDALIQAMAMHWPSDVKRQQNIKAVDVAALFPAPSGLHKLAGYALKLAEARIPMMLVGPKGTGKSHLAKDIARHLNLNYAEVPMTAGATPTWLFGAETMQGFRGRPFLDLYQNGGVFNFEEIDAADPNMLLAVNNALANGEMFNPYNGQTYKRSPDFIAVATANTFGIGANRQYSGRERLDDATLDRWRMGRILVDLDEDLETRLFFREG